LRSLASLVWPQERNAAIQGLERVGIAEKSGERTSHLSGGEQQRVAIARLLLQDPEIIVADEPVSALDVTIQAQILDLMLDLGKEYGLTMLFVSHDLAVVRHIADRIVVLFKGEIVEQGSGRELFENPQQEYTRQLLQSIPGRALLA